MAYVKTNWADRSVQYPQRFTRTSDGTYDTLVPAPGTITQAGTPITAVALNNIESGIENNDFRLTTIESWPNLWRQNTVQIGYDTANALQVLAVGSLGTGTNSIITLNGENIKVNQAGTYLVEVAADISGLGSSQTYELFIRAYLDGTGYGDYGNLMKGIPASAGGNADTVWNRNMAIVPMQANGYFQILLRLTEAPRTIIDFRVAVTKISN